MSTRLILMGGGSPEDLAAGLRFFVEKSNGGKLLFLPHGADENVFADYFAFVKTCLSPFQVGEPRLAMWPHLENRSLRELKQFAGIWIGGGNTFSLLDTFRKTRFETILREYIQNGGLVAGNSAGAIILGKDIRYAHDPNTAGVTDFTGMNFLSDHCPWAHYRPDPHDAEISLFQKQTSLPVLALPDRAAVYITDDQLTVLADTPRIFSKSQNTPINNSALL